MRKFLKGVQTHISDWNEWLTIPICIIIWFGFPYVIRVVDPTAGALDAGYLQKAVNALLFMLVGNLITFLGLKFNFLPVYKIIDTFDLESLTPWQRLKVSLFLYSLLFAAFIALVLM